MQIRRVQLKFAMTWNDIVSVGHETYETLTIPVEALMSKDIIENVGMPHVVH